MKLRYLPALSLLALALNACNTPHPDRTHEGGLIDDKVTTERVSAALERAGPEFSGVQVQTTKGRVTLSGRVGSPDVRQRAEDLARSTGRVTGVDNTIEVEKDVPQAGIR